jgi:predicted MFS family arabinose efflux permease
MTSDAESLTRREAQLALPARTVWLMAISVGVIVANIYYIQPLLADIARDFRMTVTRAGAVAMLIQIGAGAGMVLFVPLGDTHERRSLIATLLLGAAAALGLFALAPNVLWLGAAALAVGTFSSTVHVIVPYAAHLAPAGQRGRVLGYVFSGLLLGILLARTFSGFAGAQWGWRTVFWMAAGFMLLLAALIRRQLPVSVPEVTLSWAELVRSAIQLVRRHPELRESSLTGALFFAAFSAFWTTLVFRLEAPPFHYGSTVAGLFGLVGAAGALGAPLFGRAADRRGPRTAVFIALLTGFAAFLVLGFGGRTIAGLIVGVILLDLAVQAGHVSNQTRIYGLDPGARSRLNMIYMLCYFVGGAAGSYAGALAWRYFGWWGVCAFGMGAMSLGIMATKRSAISYQLSANSAVG